MERRTGKLFEVVKEIGERIYSSNFGEENLDLATGEKWGLDVDTGYMVQKVVTNMKLDQKKENIRGYKISLTSPETQSWFSAHEPAFGTLTDSNLSDGSIVLESMSEPLIEAELMFLVEKDIPGSLSDMDLLESVSVAPGIEIPDSRFSDWFPKLSLGCIVADNAVAGRIVTGKTGRKLTYEQLGDIELKLFLDGKEIAKGYSTEVLGNPLKSLKWLIAKLETRGSFLSRGMVVSSGTFVLPLKLSRGTYKASYSTLGDVFLKVE